jgi:hypothetical protein
MAHTYDVVDPVGALVASFAAPYRKFFFTNVNFVPDPMFVMWVKTGYSSIGKAASVRVNGHEIGKLVPRPWLDHSFVDFEAESFVVPRAFLFGAPFSGSTVLNTFDIVGAAGGVGDEYVLVDKVLFFHNAVGI